MDIEDNESKDITLSESSEENEGTNLRCLNFNNKIQDTNPEIDISSYLIPLSDSFEKISRIIINTFKDIVKLAFEEINKIFEEYKKSIIANLVKIDFSEIINRLKEFKFSIENAEEEFNFVLYEARWFPYVFEYMPFECCYEILEIMQHTRLGSKSRVHKIDRVLFARLSKEKVEIIRKSWKNDNTPNYLLRILNQAVCAYHRKEYAITMITLVSLWQGIIEEKSNITEIYRTDKKTKNQFSDLVSVNNFAKIYNDYFVNYIMYTCQSKEEVKEDVPGRHGALHSWLNKYPSKKAAMNAILFTDFLIKIKPIAKENNG